MVAEFIVTRWPLDVQLTAEGDSESLENACRGLLSRLDAHNSKEEPVIYPRADEELSAEATDRLRDFLGTDRMPAGWRCEKAVH